MSQKPKILISKNTILIAAGKGGVGKSTIAALLSQSLSAKGYAVGLLDADLYGPSIPTIFAINTTPVVKEDKIQPIKAHGVYVMSIGLLADQVLAWRGPMAAKAIHQLFTKVWWQDLDYLIVDLPPGTGDIHLSILENYQITGVVIVTAPTLLSMKDAAKAIELYQKFDLKIYGIIENMHIPEMIKPSGGEILAERYNLELLTSLPLMPKLAIACDAGERLSNVISFPLTWF